MQGVKFVDGIREEDDTSLGSYTKFGSNSKLNGKRLKTNNRGKTKKYPSNRLILSTLQRLLQLTITMLYNISVKTNINAANTARLGILVSLGIVLHILEGMLPSFFLPGAKLGLANVVTLTILWRGNWIEAIEVAILRIVLGNILSGNLGVGFFLSLGGGLASLGGMFLSQKKGFSLLVVSIVGALSHNLGQLAIAYFYMKSQSIFYYLPFLVLFSLPTGLLIGYLGQFLVRWEEKIFSPS